MRVTALIALLVLCACGSSSTTALRSPVAAESTSAATTPSSATPSSAASASSASSPSPPPSPVASLPCTMHATVGVDQGGFRALLGTITLPSGTIAVDPNHHIIGSTGPNGSVIWATDTSPQLYGDGGASYSPQLGGWMPVRPALVAPDGLHYSYLHVDGTLRLGDSTGQEVIVQNPKKLAPLAYTAAGVVLVTNANAANGLWLLDVSSHAINQLVAPAGNDDWREVVNGVVWGLDSPGALGAPPPTKLLEAAEQPNATVGVAYTAPAGDSIGLFAVDRQGGVLLDLKGAAPGVVYMPPGGTASPVTVQAGATVGPEFRADAHGIWFLNLSKVVLFTASGGLQAVGPALQKDVVSGGDCV